MAAKRSTSAGTSTAAPTGKEAWSGQQVLVLQGGGALGAYQGGVFEALAEFCPDPDWVAGISIGAINAALIAGNPTESRVARLREFWELVSSIPPPVVPGLVTQLLNGLDCS